MDQDKPYIKPETNLKELTLKSVILGSILSIVLSAANAYFGLFAGMTVSASIPAAVISMAVLRAFKNSNILENNLVQTAASAGESLAAGIIFTIPALVLMGYWDNFNYWETTLIAITGGILGVLFTIPLRRALIVQEKLKFPEGLATAEVLKSGDIGGKTVKFLIYGVILGGIYKLSNAALNLWNGIFEKATLFNNNTYLYFGLNLSPALIAVGYIVGLNIAFLLFLGGFISWYVAIPVWVATYGPPEGTEVADIGITVWSNHIRYLGVGAMIVGGLWALLSIKDSLVVAFKSGIAAFKHKASQGEKPLRTEIDTPMPWVIIGIVALLFPVLGIYFYHIQLFGISLIMTLVMVVAGFLFAAVAGYMAGLVGSSNNPISGVTIATILASSLLLALLLGTENPLQGASAAILIGAVVCCAAAIAGDNMQDLKAGYELGATPFKQQIMQMVGVVAGALVIAPVLNYLLMGYGIGAPTPENPQSLAAPQATLMESVATGIFGDGLPWTLVTIGGAIGIIIIIMDQWLKKRQSNFRMPVLAVAVGLYLPLELDTSIFVGGLVAWAAGKFFNQRQKSDPDKNHQKARAYADETGLLFASGLITGEALMGILIAIGLVVGNIEQWKIFATPPLGSVPGLLLLALVIGWMYYLIRKAYDQEL